MAHLLFAACRLLGEFEPHVGCWMGWPYSPYLWRDGAKPAQQQYAAIAKAISQFEPVWMFADPAVSHAHPADALVWPAPHTTAPPGLTMTHPF